MRISMNSTAGRSPPPAMSAEPKPDFSEFADFTDALRKQRLRSEQLVRRALNRAKAHSPIPFAEELNDVSRALDNALNVIERAVEELHLQNDALFAARTEVEDAYAQFRDFFEFAPAAYVVTAPDTRVRYANHAACAMLGLRRNGLAGQLLITCVPLEHRGAFRAALIRSLEPGMVSDWPAMLLSKDGTSTKPFACRMRIRAVAASGATNPTVLYWNFTEETDEDLF
jgi:PAS domain S-box-containing protein